MLTNFNQISSVWWLNQKIYWSMQKEETFHPGYLSYIVSDMLYAIFLILIMCCSHFMKSILCFGGERWGACVCISLLWTDFTWKSMFLIIRIVSQIWLLLVYNLQSLQINNNHNTHPTYHVMLVKARHAVSVSSPSDVNSSTEVFLRRSPGDVAELPEDEHVSKWETARTESKASTTDWILTTVRLTGVLPLGTGWL